MSFTEPSLNNALAEVLQNKLGRWAITSEHSGVIRDHPGRQPDVIVRSRGRSTVVLENEYFPATKVESEATERLGLVLDKSGEPIRAVVALVSDAGLKECRDHQDACRRIRQSEFRYALHAPESRFPTSGFLKGDIDDLAWFILHAGTPDDALARAIDVLDAQVRNAIDVLHQATESSPHTRDRIARRLKQDLAVEESEYSIRKKIQSLHQAFGMISTVMLNAMVYQQRLAETLAVRNIAQMEAAGDLTQSGFLREWRRVLDINYWSVFALARDLLSEINHPILANRLVHQLAEGAIELTGEGIASSEDLAGVVFQRFITDRKFLATFYTRPESAALLAHLAIPAWIGAEQYRDFRIADLACGTGTLIYAAYRRLAVLHELAGGDPEADHPHMMEVALTAADIVPSAAHLTASMLSSLYPGRGYERTNVLIPRYGRADGEGAEARDENAVLLGSLETLSKEAKLELLLPTESGHARAVASGEASAELLHATPHGSQNLVIMNPPYTRAASDWDHKGRHVKQYRGLGTTKQEQQLMSKRQRRLLGGTCFHGYAGLGSAFLAVADRMVKEDGTLAFVLPFSCANGISWIKSRRMLRDRYGDLRVVSIAGHTDESRAFSADTGMAEVLVVATRGAGNGRTTFVNLNRRPRNQAEAYEMAKMVASDDFETLEGTISGGSVMRMGNDVVGTILTAGGGHVVDWDVPGIRDLMLAQVLSHLSKGNLILPGWSQRASVSMSRVQDVGDMSVNDINIAGQSASAFRLLEASDDAVYPTIWGHDARRERGLVVAPTHDAAVREGREGKAERIWRGRSHSHLSRGTRLTSQSLTACFTEKESIGGASWPNIRIGDRKKEAAFVLWANTTLGCMMHWYHGMRSQSGRSLYSVTSYPRLPVLDVKALSAKQLNLMWRGFQRFAAEELLPINQASRDPVRQAMDRWVLVDCLGVSEDVLKPLAVVRNRWCSEPVVQGGEIHPLAKEAGETEDLVLPMAAEETGGPSGDADGGETRRSSGSI